MAKTRLQRYFNIYVGDVIKVLQPGLIGTGEIQRIESIQRDFHNARFNTIRYVFCLSDENITWKKAEE